MDTAGWLSFFLRGWGIGFTAYLCLQVATLIVVAGYHRKLLWIPIPIMAFVLVLTIQGYAQQSNLWPVFLIVCSPVAVLYLGAVWAFAAIAKTKHTRAGNDA